MKTIAVLAKTLIFLLVTNISFAQKNNPVAGHAAQLVDFLKKDYNTISTENRQDEMAKDRAKVLGIFKSYLTSNEIKSLHSMGALYATTPSLPTAVHTNKLATQHLSAISQMPVGSNAEVLAKVENHSIHLVNTEIDFLKKQHFKDGNELFRINQSFLISGNTYLAEMARMFIDKYDKNFNFKLDPYAEAGKDVSLQKSIPFLGGNLAFSTIIDGLSQFLAKRIKEELTAYMMSNIKTWLNNANEEGYLEEFKILLPKTSNYFMNFEADQLTNFVPQFKQYIEDDLNHLLENVHDLKEASRIKPILKRYPDMEFAFEALEIIPKLSDVKHSIDYFDILANTRLMSRWRADTENKWKFNIAQSIKLSELLAHSLTVNNAGNPEFINLNFVNNYVSEINFYVLYTGFIHQQNLKYYDIQFRGPRNTKDFALKDGLENLMKVIGPDASSAFNYKMLADITERLTREFSLIAEEAQSVQKYAQSIKKATKANMPVGVDTVYNFLEGTVDLTDRMIGGAEMLVNHIIDVQNTSNLVAKLAILGPLGITNIGKTIQRMDIQEKVKPYINSAHHANEIFLDLHNKHFTSAITKALLILNEVVPENNSSKIGSVAFQISMVTAKLNNDTSFKDQWKSILTNCSTWQAAASVLVDDGVRQSLVKLNEELRKVQSYHAEHFSQDRSFSNKLTKLRKAINSMALIGTGTTHSLTNDQKAAFKFAATNMRFHRLVLSYYVDTPLDAIKTELSNSMMELTVDGMPLFSEDDKRNFETLFDKWANAGATVLVDGALTASNKTLVDQGLRDLKAFILGYLESDSLIVQENIPAQLIKLIQFVDQLAQAEDSEDVEKAIDAIALPTGSYSIKRKSKFNVSLNAYPGLFGANQWIVRQRDNRLVTPKFTTGFTAPIGLSVAWGNSGCSHGFFVPIIDIGAPTAFRFNAHRDSVEHLPDFTFRNVFAPGLYYTCGFKNSPFSLNIGMQYGPQLTKIVLDGEEPDYLDSFRFGAAITLDIPLLNIYTRPREFE